MPEIDIDVELGPVTAIDLASLTGSGLAITGQARLMGWSIRESGAQVGQEAEGNVVAPAAGATIVSVAPLVGQTYSVSWQVQLIGAAAAADADNFGLYAGGTLLDTSLNAGAAGQYSQPTIQHFNPSDLTYAIKAIGAGTAGVTYAAQIAIMPVNQQGAQVELRDGNSVLAEIVAQLAGGDTRWFGPSGIMIRNQVKSIVAFGAATGALYISFER